MTASASSAEQTWLRKRPRSGLGTPVGPPDPRNRGSEARSRAMLIIGCDFRTRCQQIAMANGESGELLLERRLAGGPGHSSETGKLLIL